MNEISVQSVKINNNRIDIYFSVSQDLNKYFSQDKHFWTEYSSSIEGVPMGIALVPFVCNILPIVWITDSNLILPELDESFFYSIDDVKRGYVDMCPQIKFSGNIFVTKLSKTDRKTSKKALLFSGGADAFSSLVSLSNNELELVTIWGSDISVSNQNAWKKVDQHIRRVSEDFNFPYRIVKSNFRDFINEKNLNILVLKSGDNYWHGFQHGIGLLGLEAPYCYLFDIKELYISSSFSEKEKEEALSLNRKIVCASDSSIDNKLKFGDTYVIHYQPEMNRQDKIRNICNYYKQDTKKIDLRVCWRSLDGINCCKCEKCCRTIAAIWAEGGDPRAFGFNISKDFYKYIIFNLKYKVNVDTMLIQIWNVIQSRFVENKKNIEEVNFMNWIVNVDFDTINNNLLYKLRKIYLSVCFLLKSVLKKIL